MSSKMTDGDRRGWVAWYWPRVGGSFLFVVQKLSCITRYRSGGRLLLMNSSLPSGVCVEPSCWSSFSLPHGAAQRTSGPWHAMHQPQKFLLPPQCLCPCPPANPYAMLLVLAEKPWKHGTDSPILDLIWLEPCRLGELWTFVQGTVTPKGSASPPFLPFIRLEAKFSFQGLELFFRKICFIELTSLNAREKVEKRLSKFSLLLTKPWIWQFYYEC